MSKSEHSKLPWLVDSKRPYLVANVCGVLITLDTPPTGGGPYPSCGKTGTLDCAKENAEFIALACNSYDEMLAVLKSLVRFDGRYADGMIMDAIDFEFNLEGLRDRAKKVITKAESK